MFVIIDKYIFVIYLNTPATFFRCANVYEKPFKIVRI